MTEQVPVRVQLTRDEMALVQTIVGRVGAIFANARLRNGFDRLSATMDLTAVHTGCCPLRLADLAVAGDVDLVHDVVGISTHLDRTTKTLGMGFTPRFAVDLGRWA